jgi:hypothetical protein
MDIHLNESEWVGRIFIFGSGTSKLLLYRTWNPTHTRCTSHHKVSHPLSRSYQWKQTVFISGLRVGTNSEFEQKSSRVELEWWKTDRSFVAETGGIVDKQRHLLGEGEGGIATIIVGLVVREENESIECFPSFLTRYTFIEDVKRLFLA